MSGSKNTGRNESITFFRILFTLVILIHHASSFPGGHTLLLRGYLCVEFFFIVSGFFLYRSFRDESRHSTLSFIKKRLVRLYPEYLFAFLVITASTVVLSREFDLNRAVNELLMVQNTGIFHIGGYNFPCWYIAVMMVSGILIYNMLSLHENAFVKVIAPLIVIGCYTWLTGSEDGFETWTYIGPLSMPLLRGFADMSLGVILSAFVEELSPISEKLDLCMELLALFLIFLGMFTNAAGEVLTVAAFCLLILSLTAGENVLSRYMSGRRWIAVAGGYCYSVYLNHGVWVKLFQYLGKRVQIPFVLLIYLFLVIVYSIFTKWIVDRVIRGIAERG